MIIIQKTVKSNTRAFFDSDGKIRMDRIGQNKSLITLKKTFI